MIKPTMNLVISLNVSILAPALYLSPVKRRRGKVQSLIEVTIAYFNVGNI